VGAAVSATPGSVVCLTGAPARRRIGATTSASALPFNSSKERKTELGGHIEYFFLVIFIIIHLVVRKNQNNSVYEKDIIFFIRLIALVIVLIVFNFVPGCSNCYFHFHFSSNVLAELGYLNPILR
jgi:hypothetical protein